MRVMIEMARHGINVEPTAAPLGECEWLRDRLELTLARVRAVRRRRGARAAAEGGRWALDRRVAELQGAAAAHDFKGRRAAR